MARINDYKLTISKVGENVRIDTDSDGNIIITMTMRDNDEPSIRTSMGEEFVRINIEGLTPNDEWLFHTPKTKNQQKFMEIARNVILDGNIKSFFIPYDFYKIKFFESSFGTLHIGSSSCNQWIESAKSHGSKMLTFNRYILLLAFMLKRLCDTGLSKDEAWSLICDNSCPMSKINWIETFGFKDFRGYRKFLLPDDSENVSGCYIAYPGNESYGHVQPLATIISDSRRDVSLEYRPYLCYGTEYKD